MQVAFLGEPLPYDAGHHSESQPAPGATLQSNPQNTSRSLKKEIKYHEGTQHLPATRTGFYSVVPDRVTKIKRWYL